jgi:hypothetical protein
VHLCSVLVSRHDTWSSAPPFNPLAPRQVSGFAALSLGLVFASSCKEDLVEAILTGLMSRSGDVLGSGEWRVVWG